MIATVVFHHLSEQTGAIKLFKFKTLKYISLGILNVLEVQDLLPSILGLQHLLTAMMLNLFYI